MTGRRHLPDQLKRVRGTPTGSTPCQPSKRRSIGRGSSRRKLMYGTNDEAEGNQQAVTSSPTSSKPKLGRAVLIASSADGWSDAEEMALIEFLLLHGDGSRWMATKQVRFWEGASKFLFQRCGSKRTSGACRSRVTKKLSQQFSTPKEAEGFFLQQLKSQNEDLSDLAGRPTNSPEAGEHSTGCQETLPQVPLSSPEPTLATLLSRPNYEPSCSLPSTPPFEDSDGATIQQFANPHAATRMTTESPESQSSSVINIHYVDTLQPLSSQLRNMDAEQQLSFISDVFTSIAARERVVVPNDFLQLSLLAMKQLQASGRSNMLYGLAAGLGTKRKDDSDSIFPSKRVVAGLIEYSVNFFNGELSQNVICPADYRMWLETMYCLFGNRWLNLHGGPMWSVESTEQGQQESTGTRVISEVRVNIPALSSRTIQRDISKSNLMTDSKIQTGVLDEAVMQLPHTQWWIKSDGCDVVSGLMESTRGIWSGDVDLGDGSIKSIYSAYCERLNLIDGLCCQLNDNNSRRGAWHDLLKLKSGIVDDRLFIDEALKKSIADYDAKQLAGSATDKTLYSLGWTVDELSRLNEQCRNLHVEVTTLIEQLEDQTLSWTTAACTKISKTLFSIKARLQELVKGVTRHKRTAATHILVTMISPCERNRKPYALPICCMPYVSLNEMQARAHINLVIEEMLKRNMKVAGFVSNGEYNVFRAKGYSRPLSIIQLRSMARKKYSTMGVKKMMAMLTPKVDTDGKIVAEVANKAVSSSLIREIHSWIEAGASSDDVLGRLRLHCVPPGFTPHPWIPGKDEDTPDKLRSILSQLEYKFQVNYWDQRGVPFKTHVYVPETHPKTRDEFHEREDDAHVLKRIASATRSGGPNDIDLERFAEALEDPSSGLTYTALTGKRKQSVRDAERLFSSSMVQFMKSKGYSREEKYIEMVLNWRRASDERGLSELQRSRYNYQMLNYLLDELIPWLDYQKYDFSTLEVNKEINNVRGLSRETLLALTTTIESREWMRRKNAMEGHPPEHPRASSTDDVECFFSQLRNMIGSHFTVKEVQYAWRKICLEFSKRLDRNLPFFYYTSKHERFTEGDRPSFNVYQKPKSNPRHQRVRRREQPGNLAVGRATMVMSGAKSLRRQFHSLPVELPPPPGCTAQHLTEHSYY